MPFLLKISNSLVTIVGCRHRTVILNFPSLPADIYIHTEGTVCKGCCNAVPYIFEFARTDYEHWNNRIQQHIIYRGSP